MANISSSVMPPAFQSVAEMRTDIGRSAGHTARIAEKTSSGKRSRFSIEPPYASSALIGERRQEGGEEIAMGAVQFEHVEAGARATFGGRDETPANLRPCRRDRVRAASG